MPEDPPVGGSASWPPPVTGPQVAAGDPPPPPTAPLVPPPPTPPAPSGTSPASGRRWLLLLGLAVVVLAAAGTAIALALGGSGAAAGSAAARRLLAQSLADARAAGSFHYVSTSVSTSGTGRLTQTTIGDAGATEGRQDITVNGDRFTVLVLGPTTYFRGDALAMATSLGVPAPVAAAHAGQWIALVSGDSPYPSVTAAVTTSSALEDNVTFRAQQELPLAKIAGRQLQGVRGAMQTIEGQQAHGTATLYMTTGSRPMPVRYVEQGTVGKGSNAGSLDFSLTFSAWAEPVRVSAPSGALAFSALAVPGATPSPGPGPTYYT